MALKKRNLKVAVTTMAMVAALSTTGVNNIVSADSTINTTIERTSDSKHTIKNSIEYIDKNGEIQTSGHGYETLRSSISEDTVIEVKDGKTYMTVQFTDAAYSYTGEPIYGYLSDICIIVDGTEHKFEKNESKLYTVELPSLESNIQVSYKIMGRVTYTMNVKLSEKDVETEAENKAPVINVSDKTMYVGETFDALSGATTGVATDSEDGDLTKKLEVIGNVDTTKPGTYQVTYKVTDSKGLETTKTITVTVLVKEEVKPNGLEDGKYKVNNTTKYPSDSEMGNTMVRNSLEEVSYIEVKDGEVYVTLNFEEDMYSQMNNIKITVDGETVNSSANGRAYTFKVKSIDSEIGISANIAAMGGRAISYNVSLVESTIEKVSSSTNNGETNNENINNENTNSGTTNNGSTNEDTSSDTTIKEEATLAGKVATVGNNVYHDSETGQAMARQYLKSSSKIEDINGQKYVTLTFTGSEFMKNHAIYVNGSKVSHTVTAKSGDSISLRFKVSDFSDTIKVGMYVIPMGRDIDFTVKLDTTNINWKEMTSSDLETLPQTGSVVDGTMAIGVGSSLMALGTLLNRRKRK